MKRALHAAWRTLFRRPEPDDVLQIGGLPSWSRPYLAMHACGARDQVACMAAARGWDAFEAPMPRFFADAVEGAGNRLVIDVGANTGFYTLLALAVSRTSIVAAYEPMATVRRILLSNLKLNRAGRRARVLPYAASARNGSGALYVPDPSHGLVETSASLSGAFKGHTGKRYTVKIVTLDSLHASGPAVGVIKIDAESHDLDVLRGAEAILARDRPTVFLEVLFGADEKGLSELLHRQHYVDFVLRPDGVIKASATVAHDTDAWNHMWLPAERTSAIDALSNVDPGPAA